MHVLHTHKPRTCSSCKMCALVSRRLKFIVRDQDKLTNGRGVTTDATSLLQQMATLCFLSPHVSRPMPMSPMSALPPYLVTGMDAALLSAIRQPFHRPVPRKPSPPPVLPPRLPLVSPPIQSYVCTLRSFPVATTADHNSKFNTPRKQLYQSMSSLHVATKYAT